jgi:predicted membrane channel-forming protein YqfA (hemolysin III family)
MGEDTVALSLQLGLSAVMVVLMTIVHSLGLVGISKLLHLNKDRLEERDFDIRAVLLLGSVGLLIFALHILEICIFAALNLALGITETVGEALTYSASNYATLGRTGEYVPTEWRLLGAVEALIGFVLISWSAAYVATTMNRLRR